MNITDRPSAFLRLKRAAEFQSVYKGGAKRVTPSFVVFVLPNGCDYSRVGLTTSRKIGRAVERNRIRRRVREILRAGWSLVPRGVDIVVNPRRSAATRAFGDLKSELLSALGVAL